MAGTIKGITIEFSADATKLNSALKQTNSTISKTQSELKSINRALKFNPGNTTLLTQKFNLLKASVNQAETQLDQLRKTQAMMSKNGIDQTSAQYRQLERDILKAENRVKSAKEELKRFGSVGSQQVAAVGEKMKTVGGKMTGVGRSITTGVTMPLMLVGGAAARTTADFDSAMSNVQAISGATGKEFDALRNKAREMGAKTKFSATESADAFGYMAMAGWKTGDMLDGIEGIMNLAAASGEDLATTSDIVTDALTAFGLKASDSGHFADVLAAASSNANTNVGMMGETFKYAAPIAGALGFSVEDTAEAIGLMANAGIKSSQAGTSLRTIMNNLSKDFTVSGKAIGDVEIATTNADGSMRSLGDILTDTREAFSGLSESEKAAAAESLVGKNAMSGFLALMNASPEDIGKLETALSNADGTAEGMAETMNDNFGGQLTILKSQLSEAGIAIGDTLVPFMESLVSIVQTLVDKFNALSPTTKRVIVVAAMIVGALGPVLTGVGLMITMIGSILTFAPALSAAAATVGGAISAAALPVTGIVVAIGAAIAIGVALYKNWGTIKKYAKKVWGDISKKVTKLVDIIKTNVVGSFQAVKDFVLTAWNTIKNGVTTAVTTVKNVIMRVFNAVKSFITTVWDGIKSTISKAWEAIKKGVTTAVNGVKTVISTVFNAIKTVIQTYVNAWKFVITTVFNAIKTFVTNAVNGWKKIITTAFNAIKTGINTAVNAIKTVVTTVFTAIKTKVSTIVTSIKTAVTNAFNTIKTKVSTAVTGVKTAVTNAFNTIKTKVAAVVASIKTTVTNAFNNIKTKVTNAVTGLKDKAVSAFNTLKTKVSTAVTNAKNAIINPFKKAKEKVSEIVNGVKDKVTSVFNSLKSKVTTVWNSIKSAITDPISKAKETVSGVIEKIKGLFPLKVGEILSNIELPKFHVSGGKIPYGFGGKGYPPKIWFTWNKKAMQNPYMFTGATLFGAGEAGDEVLYGRKALMRDIASAMTSVSGGGGVGTVINVYGTNSMDVNDLALAVEQRIITMQKRRSSAWA